MGSAQRGSMSWKFVNLYRYGRALIWKHDIANDFQQSLDKAIRGGVLGHNWVASQKRCHRPSTYCFDVVFGIILNFNISTFEWAATSPAAYIWKRWFEVIFQNDNMLKDFQISLRFPNVDVTAEKQQQTWLWSALQPTLRRVMNFVQTTFLVKTCKEI